MELLEALTQASAYFGETLLMVGDDDWELPVGEWNIQQLVAHVVVNDAEMAAFLAGETDSWATDADVSVLGTNPVAAWRGSVLKLLDAASQPDALSQKYTEDNLNVEYLIGLRVLESAVHGWDLSRALGQDRSLPGGVVDWCLEFVQPMVRAIISSDAFDSPIEVAINDDAQTRLLALLGRK